MKKIYLCVVALSVGTLSFGQMTTKKHSFEPNSNDIKTSSEIELTENAVKPLHSPLNNKAITTIWSDNFNTPANWVVNNDGQTGAQYGWTIDSISDGWWSANGITSTSGGNYAELSNGDPRQGATNPQALNVTYTLTTANPINLVALGGSDKVFLEFEQFGARFNDLQEIQISTDGTTFITVGNNLDKSVLSINGGAAYPNPDIKLINLSSFLTPTTATSVWLRFSWTTNFPAQATNANVWVAYGWYIDNIKINTLPSNDLATSLPYYGSLGWDYTRIPTTQIAPIDFGVRLSNEGLNDITGVTLNVNINSGAFTFNSIPFTSMAGSVDSVFATFTPPATVGIPYTAVLSLSSDSIDEIPANNPNFTLSPFQVSAFTYARDDFAAAPGNGGGPNSATSIEFEAGNLFDIFTNQTLYGIDIVVGPGTATIPNTGAAIQAVIYVRDTAGAFIEIDRSIFHSVVAADLGNVVTLRMPNTPTLLAGSSYFAAVAAFSPFLYGTSGTSQSFDANIGGGGNTSLIFYPTMAAPNTGEAFFTRNTPMVRMNFDPGASVKELSSNTSFNVFPNPSNDIFNITLDAKNAEVVNLTVTNIVGQLVISKRITVSGQTKETISLAGFDKGIYFLTIDNNKQKQTVKLIVE